MHLDIASVSSVDYPATDRPRCGCSTTPHTSPDELVAAPQRDGGRTSRSPARSATPSRWNSRALRLGVGGQQASPKQRRQRSAVGRVRADVHADQHGEHAAPVVRRRSGRARASPAGCSRGSRAQRARNAAPSSASRPLPLGHERVAARARARAWSRHRRSPRARARTGRSRGWPRRPTAAPTPRPAAPAAACCCCVPRVRQGAVSVRRAGRRGQSGILPVRARPGRDRRGRAVRTRRRRRRRATRALSPPRSSDPHDCGPNRMLSRRSRGDPT